jgi:hypothetical protein
MARIVLQYKLNEIQSSPVLDKVISDWKVGRGLAHSQARIKENILLGEAMRALNLTSFIFVAQEQGIIEKLAHNIDAQMLLMKIFMGDFQPSSTACVRENPDVNHQRGFQPENQKARIVLLFKEAEIQGNSLLKQVISDWELARRHSNSHSRIKENILVGEIMRTLNLARHIMVAHEKGIIEKIASNPEASELFAKVIMGRYEPAQAPVSSPTSAEKKAIPSILPSQTTQEISAKTQDKENALPRGMQGIVS